MAVDSRDRDGDSEMASSVGSPHTDSDRVEAGACTPTHHAQIATASELSPPGSQPQQIPDISTTTEFRHLGEADVGQPPDKNTDPPIAAWKSKRAQDEYQRAMEQVIDKDFNLNEFGDPFDERDLEEKLL
ncbi:uncharacterized protein N7482_003829 [Penicillium canariense]|uniref:Uncharacterized protein n=1 Tax=Penicillium canariense TaxID=189055 RepID=A0A9W9LPP4_9EURO|nr:uncharacterized protein N7482_003829 [Penicillium canariense]KAJ5168235.1 hypothetical protein N7482_003829 [Penicillium canariense]